ncbi:hypothetical protein [Pedobacter endophyticus]|uniref:Uncharacterized protein n=1 Tax=Pedobacter endophyticus TaxID=2789740 RepID=A0A7S9L2P4_9SPHI|nr:hypothetical protein [Pedobacter endophyticus]QPH41372.1 hypothetical protein IZT61_09000 [Pedobacter endophyticus]
MENNEELQPVPSQQEGSKIDVVSQREFATNTEASLLFNKAVQRLLSVNNWGDYAGMSAFQLYDADGVEVQRQATEGDYIRIDIPGPGAAAGKGFDWVHIEKIENSVTETESWVAMRVRPSAHPNSSEDDTAHFLKDIATSTFIIRQVDRIVYAEEHGRNEVPNTDGVGVYDKGRNLIVALAAKFGLSYPQWKSLVNGLLSD